jgi:23S rRNA pseudouridine1911/1915/1917 synthase
MSEEVKVSAELAGARLDKAVVELVSGASRAKVKTAIADRKIRVNGRVLPKGGLVKEGDVITFDANDFVAGEAPCTPDPDAPLTVLHETKKVVVVDKPAGQPSAPLRAGEMGTLANAVLGRYPEIAGVGHSPREPGLVHRLDTDTSGVIVVARTKDAFDALADALKSEQIEKTYVVVCASDGLADEGTIEFPIANHPKDKRRVYPCIHPRDVIRYEPRPALTHYVVLERGEKYALCEVSIKKALRHQIRAHFAAIGHALVGDALYGGDAVEGLSRHALHASRVSWIDDDPALAFDVSSPVPEALRALLKIA